MNTSNTLSTNHDSDPLIIEVASLSSATLHEAAGKIGALPAAVKPLAASMRVCGRALPVNSPAGDNLWLHHAIYEAGPGEVLVVDVGGGRDFGYWGEVMALAAQVRGIAGLVITGGVRDSLRIIDMGFPVFSATVCIQGTGKDPRGAGSIGKPICIGDVQISRGDIVFGDADGVVVLPAGRALEIAAESVARDQAELAIFEQLRAGKSTLDIYRLPILENRS
jgi:4-hydroxy-4-methyl-2-oxoglutarate aldolase